MLLLKNFRLECVSAIAVIFLSAYWLTSASAQLTCDQGSSNLPGVNSEYWAMSHEICFDLTPDPPIPGSLHLAVAHWDAEVYAHTPPVSPEWEIKEPVQLLPSSDLLFQDSYSGSAAADALATYSVMKNASPEWEYFGHNAIDGRAIVHLPFGEATSYATTSFSYQTGVGSQNGQFTWYPEWITPTGNPYARATDSSPQPDTATRILQDPVYIFVASLDDQIEPDQSFDGYRSEFQESGRTIIKIIRCSTCGR